MKKIKIMIVFGTRPEAVKMAPLAITLKQNDIFDVKICVTAQHREMLDQVLSIFSVKPDFDLDIMKASQSLAYITSQVLNRTGDIIKSEKPDLVLVHGDTSTTFSAALSSFYAQVPVGHVEAGLRTYDRYSPFPEEMNRRLTSQLASIHFAPTQSNRENLLRENISKNVFITGNTVIDAIHLTVKGKYTFHSHSLQNLSGARRTILVTAHRRENLGAPLEHICQAIKMTAENFKDVQIIYPVHLNPAVQQTAHSVLDGLPNVVLCEPLDVEDMHNLMARAYMVMTDSGGLQEEAPALGKPVLVLRTETERPEAVEAGTVKIAGTDTDNIYGMARELLQNTESYIKMSKAVNPYGDGKACRRIEKAIMFYFGLTSRPADFNYRQ